MARVFTFLMFLVGMSVLLGYAGIQTGSATLLQALGFLNSPQDIQGSTLFSTISAIFTVGSVAVIVIGLFARQSSESIIAAILCASLLAFASDFVSVYIYVTSVYPDSWVQYILAPLMAAIVVGYAVSIVSYWRGSD